MLVFLHVVEKSELHRESVLKSDTVEARGIILQDMLLGGGAQVFSLLQVARGETLAVPVGHIGAHDDLRLSDELEHLRQEKILQFGAKKQIALFDIVHHRQRLRRFRR